MSVARHGGAAELAAAMVEALRARSCITSPAVAEAFRSVPRHVFVPGTPLSEAYSFDTVVPTHFDAEGCRSSSSSAPNIMAIMLEQLRVGPGMSVLEIGAGTGYNAGLLAHLVGPTGRVVTVDIDDDITTEARAAPAHGGHRRRARGARRRLARLREPPSGSIGSSSPSALADISPHWFEQLNVGGVLVMPLCVAARPAGGGRVRARRGAASGARASVCAASCASAARTPGPTRTFAVPGWCDRVEGVTAERNWIAAIDTRHSRAGRAAPEPARRAGRREPGAVARPGLDDAPRARRARLHRAVRARCRSGTWRSACSISDRPGLAVFDAGKIVVVR